MNSILYIHCFKQNIHWYTKHTVGLDVGDGVGEFVGLLVGDGVGLFVGFGVGLFVGDGVGDDVGESVGEFYIIFILFIHIYKIYIFVKRK